jgi:hypothetical protein
MFRLTCIFPVLPEVLICLEQQAAIKLPLVAGVTRSLLK